MAIQYGGTTLSSTQQAYLERLMTERLAQRMVFDKYLAGSYSLPQRSGSTIKFKKFVPMKDLMIANDIYKNYTGNDVDNAGEAIATLVPQNYYQDFILPEGSSGDEKGDMKVIELSTDVMPIGMWTSVTEETSLLSDMYTTKEHVTQMSEVASLALDGFYRDIMLNGAGHVIDDTSTTIDTDQFAKDVRKISVQLRLSGARYINEIMTSSPNYGTVPVYARYIAIINTLAGESLRENTAFVPVEKYGASIKPLDGEIGMIGDVRFIENENAYIYTSTDTDGNTHYYADILIMGKEHTYNIPLRGKGRIEVIVKGLGENGDDPLNRKQIVGFKSWIGALTIHPEKLGLIKVEFKPL